MPRRGAAGALAKALLALSCIALGLAAALAGPAAAAPQRLTFANLENSAFNDAAAEILREAYRKLDIAVAVEVLPPERALRRSNSGAIDGEVVRAEGIEQTYKNLVRVPVSYMRYELHAFGRDAGTVIDGWQSLTPYKLVFQRGFKEAEAMTDGMNRHLVASVDTAFRMVAAGRMDVVLAGRYPGEAAIERLKLDNVFLLQPSVQVYPLYHYLHRNHADLVPRLIDVMIRMQAEGEMDAIRQKHGIGLVGG